MATEKNKKSGTKTSAAKNSGRGKSTGTAGAKKQPKKQNDRLSAIIIAVVFIVLGVFLFAAVKMNAAGQFGLLIGEFLKGTLGSIGVIFPVYLILFGVLMLVNKSEKFSKLGFFLGLIILFMIAVINSGHFIDGENISFKAKELYESGIELKSGGLFGMLIAGLLVKYIGKIGLYVVGLGVIVISGLILFRNTPVKKFINSVRLLIQRMTLGLNDMQKAREEKKTEEEEQLRKIEENKARIEENKAERLRRREDERNRNSGGIISDADADQVTIPSEKTASSPAAIREGNTTLFPDGHTAIDDTTVLDHTYYPGKKSMPTISFIGDEVSVKSSPVDIDMETGSGEFGLEPRRVQMPKMGIDDTVELTDEDREILEKAAAQMDEKMPKKDKAAEESQNKTPSGVDKETSKTDQSSDTKRPNSNTSKNEEKKLTRKEAEESTLKESDFNKPKKNLKYKKPGLELLNVIENKGDPSAISSELQQKSDLLERTLTSFNVGAKVVHVTQGPTVTRYEIQPDAGVKVSKIKNLQDDIALNLGAKSIRIEAPIPGKSVVGIEIENDSVNMVSIRELIASKAFKDAESKISFCVGRDISGDTIVADLKTMPHLLIAGSTGSGKSVCINGIITSILYKADPEDVKLILIDPKVVELGDYNGIPHLLIPVVTDPSKAAAALNWAVAEMTDRYKKFADAQVRNLASYNQYVEDQLKKMKDSKDDYDSRSDGIAIEKPEKLPQIVIIIDELADLMMAAPSQVEDSICRIAQLARAAGMHLIVATQRPSTDVITGVIKANIPSRIAFAVASQYDSRTILDIGGAEKLVGKGDMLYSPLSMNHPIRVQGCFISDEEIHRVITYVKQQGDADYSDKVMDTINSGSVSGGTNEVDELYNDAVEFVISAGKASTSLIQRRFRIGYNRAANIIDEMELRGIIGPADGSKPRQILVTSVPSERPGAVDYTPEPEPEFEPEPVPAPEPELVQEPEPEVALAPEPDFEPESESRKDIEPEPEPEEETEASAEIEPKEPSVITEPKTSAELGDLTEYINNSSDEEENEPKEPIKSVFKAQQYSEPIEEEDVNQDISDLWADLDGMESL